MSKKPKVSPFQAQRKKKSPRHIFRSIRTRLLRLKGKKCFILNLDKVILHKIFGMLEPVDQACLALSCKKYLYLFWRVNGMTLWGPRVGKHTIVPTSDISLDYTTRELLSHRLRNPHWVFCEECRHLHTRKAYERQENARRKREKYTAPSYGGSYDSYSPLQMSDMFWANQVLMDTCYFNYSCGC